MTKATRVSVQLLASLGLRGGGGGKEYHGPNLLSCQANVRERLPSFLHYTAGMLGDAPEKCRRGGRSGAHYCLPEETYPRKEDGGCILT